VLEKEFEALIQSSAKASGGAAKASGSMTPR
jgi:hypothetical protein